MTVTECLKCRQAMAQRHGNGNSNGQGMSHHYTPVRVPCSVPGVLSMLVAQPRTDRMHGHIRRHDTPHPPPATHVFPYTPTQITHARAPHRACAFSLTASLQLQQLTAVRQMQPPTVNTQPPTHLPEHMSRTRWSWNSVILSYTSDTDSPEGKR